jgi:Zn-dependent protease
VAETQTIFANETQTPLSAPDPVFNCPGCSMWLPPGTLACPECHAIVYARHLEAVARRAVSLEGAQRWAEARETWHSALGWLPGGTRQAAVVQGRIDTIDARAKAADDTRAKWTKRLGPLAPAALFLMKAKGLLLVIFKFKFLLTFLASFGLYWAIFGWKFGLGIVLSILIHEMGHYVAVRRRGLKAELPIFLPGLGAYVRWFSQGVTLEDLGAIALAGPMAGLLAALACFGLYRATGMEVFGALANRGAWLNLLNLVPVLGLDGAQATYALNRVQRGLVLATCVAFFVFLHEWMFVFIAAGMGWRVFTGVAPEQPSSRTMTTFILLLFLLGTVMWLVPTGQLSRY